MVWSEAEERVERRRGSKTGVVGKGSSEAEYIAERELAYQHSCE